MERPLTVRCWQPFQRFALLALAMLAAAVFAHARFAIWTDAQIQDVLARWLPTRASPQQVIIVDIDERSLTEIGPWPWPRPVIAQLMLHLRQQGAKLQVWDSFFSDRATGDEQIQALFAGQDRHDLVWGQVPVIDPYVKDPPRQGQLRASADAPDLCSAHDPVTGYLGVASSLQPPLVGHLAATPDPDGRLRRLPAVLCLDGQRYPQLVLAAAQALQPQAPWVSHGGAFPFGPAQWLDRGNLRFALDQQGDLTIPYWRPHTAWPAISAARLLAAQAGAPSVSGAIVIVGSSALGISDIASTPFHPSAPGVSVHAELLAAAIDHVWLSPARAPDFIAAMLVGLFGLVLLPSAPARSRVLWLLGSLSAALLAPTLAAAGGRLGGVLLPVTAPAVALLGYSVGLLLLQASAERREARRLADHLASFLPRGLAQDIATQTPSGDSLGKPCQGVLLALRVAGLERWTSSVDSLQALAMVHAVSTVAERSAQRHGGALEHLQGETLLMAWSHADANSVHAAIATALDLGKELDLLLRRNETERYPLGVRAAIESGAFLLGVAGSRTSRRPVLLGPTADAVLAMLALSDELASPLLVGDQAASALPVDTLQPLGCFLLPDHPRSKQLYRVVE